MAQRRIIKVGSRGSVLALRQNEEVLEPLRSLYPDVDFQVVVVRTLGDINPEAPLAGMGLGIFVSEIERQLLAGELDMAVHSLKDMPTKLPEGLVLGALSKRKDPRDVLVNRWHCPMAGMPDGARIGTSSPRRQALLKSLCPHATGVPIRGNVETRLQKGVGEDYDGVVTAAAALQRLGISDQAAEYLSPQRFVPPPGQGVLAVEIRAEDDSMQNMVRSVEDTPTRLAATAERAFLEKLGGGCQMAVGAYARAQGEILFMTIFISSPDGQKSFRAKIDGLNMDPLQLASDAYLAVVERGGGPLLEIEWSELTE